MKEEARTNLEVEAGLPEELTLESVHLKFQEWRSQSSVICIGISTNS